MFTGYALLRQIRESVLGSRGIHDSRASTGLIIPAFEPWGVLPVPQDPWHRPAWDTDTVVLFDLTSKW